MQSAFPMWPTTTNSRLSSDSARLEAGRYSLSPVYSPSLAQAPRRGLRSLLQGWRAVGLALFALSAVFLVLAVRQSPGDGGAAARRTRRYQHQESYGKYNSSNDVLRIAIISDRDTRSKNDKFWESDLLLGTLTRNRKGEYTVAWDKETILLTSQLNENQRAMELSELVYFNGKLLAFDDRTGLVAEIDIANKMAVPLHILMEGDGHTTKGQKTEWATVKDDLLYVGSIGKEWTNKEGKVVNHNNQWVSTIDTEGRIKHIDWIPVFEGMRSKTGTGFPGYLIHEAVCWNPKSRKWWFLPRKVSNLPYDDEADEARCSNTFVTWDEAFTVAAAGHIGPMDTTHGFSSCKFVPFREDEIVALKTMEYQGVTKSYITVLRTNGDILMPESYIADNKFEGLEFI
eukprot:m51a1_g10943 nucleoside diphosphate phosphatase, putative (400) ;mRNA; r:187979-189560